MCCWGQAIVLLKNLQEIPSVWKTIVFTFYLLLVCIGLQGINFSEKLILHWAEIFSNIIYARWFSLHLIDVKGSCLRAFLNGERESKGSYEWPASYSPVRLPVCRSPMFYSMIYACVVCCVKSSFELQACERALMYMHEMATAWMFMVS